MRDLAVTGEPFYPYHIPLAKGFEENDTLLCVKPSLGCCILPNEGESDDLRKSLGALEDCSSNEP